MEFFQTFTIKHGKVVRIIMSFIVLGLLNTLIANEEVRESIPSFLSGGDVADERLVLLGDSHVDEMQSGGIELLVDLLPRKQVVQVLGSWMKTLLNYSPKLNRHKVYVDPP
jgi:hypothetical protein